MILLKNPIVNFDFMAAEVLQLMITIRFVS